MTRKQLDHLLENSVAQALGLPPVHQAANRPLRSKLATRPHGRRTPAPSRERVPMHA